MAPDWSESNHDNKHESHANVPCYQETKCKQLCSEDFGKLESPSVNVA